MMNDAGIETVITACPECYRTLSSDYERHGLRPAFTVMHLYEFLEREIDKGAVTFAPLDKRITYQDSCRLNRLDGMKDVPRKLIDRLAPVGFKEMKDSGASSICCGNCAWTGCDAYSKALQVRRIPAGRGRRERPDSHLLSQMPDPPPVRHGRPVPGQGAQDGNDRPDERHRANDPLGIDETRNEE